MGKMSKVAAGMLCGALLLTGCAGGNNTPVVQGGASTVEGTPMTTPSPTGNVKNINDEGVWCTNAGSSEYKVRYGTSYSIVENLILKEDNLSSVKLDLSSEISCTYTVIPELKKKSTSDNIERWGFIEYTVKTNGVTYMFKTKPPYYEDNNTNYVKYEMIN